MSADLSGEFAQPTKRRKSGLTTLELHLLEQACQPVWRAFGHTYLVGTATTGGEYRDVDVRTIVCDDEFDRRFGVGGENDRVDGQAFWALVCSSVGRMLAEQTGLPIDYQIQRWTEANEKYKGERNPVGHGHRVYAGGGDATGFASAGRRRGATVAEPSYDDLALRGARALFEHELGPYAASIGESWETQKQDIWKAHAHAVLRATGVTCQWCPVWDGTVESDGFPACGGCGIEPYDAEHFGRSAGPTS